MKFRTLMRVCFLLLSTVLPAAFAQDDSINIVASNSIIADVVSNVAGDMAAVSSLIPRDTDPHSFAPSTGDIVALAGADVVFVNGAGFEEGLLDAIENAGTDMNIVEVSACVHILPVGATAESHDDAMDADMDMHDDEMSDMAMSGDEMSIMNLSEMCHSYEAGLEMMHSDEMAMSGDDSMDMDTGHSMHSSGTNSAIYMSITNNSGADDTLLAASATFAGLIEIHETTVENDIARMQEREGGIEIAAGETVTLQPGGLHIMVMDLQADLNEGDTVEVMLEFASGTMVAVSVPIAEFEEDAPEMMLDTEGFSISALRARPAAAGTMAMDDAHDTHHGTDTMGALYSLDCGGDHSDNNEAHNHGACDPHVWMDVHNVMLWTLLVRDTLSELDPDNATMYAANADAYLVELAALESSIEMQLAAVPEENRVLITNHESLAYLAARYDFELVGTVIPGGATVAEPSAADVAALIETLQANNVTAIFSENTVNTDIAAQIAAETGAEVYLLYSGSLSAADDEAGTYLEYMRFNIETIARALGADM